MGLQTINIRVAENGRMVLPARVRKALGVIGEGKLVLTIRDGEVLLQPLSAHLRRAQQLYRDHVKEDRSVDDFLGDRKVDEQSRGQKLRHTS